MTDTKEIVLHDGSVQLGTIQASSPTDVVVRATVIAQELKRIIVDRKLYKNIKGRNYVYVDAWTTMGAMLGVLPREVDVIEQEDGSFEATVELIRASDGAIIGKGSAICGMDEKEWSKRPRYARRSMAITRATGKAFRLGFSWIITLAGYAPTPAEEMDDVVDGEIVEYTQPEPKPEPKPERPYPVFTVQDKIAGLITKYGDAEASADQRGLLRGMMTELFAGDPASEAKYRTVANMLTGCDSTSKMTGAQVRALLDWIRPTKDSGDAWVADPMATREAHMIEHAALFAAGQTELPIE